MHVKYNYVYITWQCNLHSYIKKWWYHIYIFTNYTMARKATEFPAQWVQMSDFKWAKDMTKKNRWICKTFIDWILADVEKRDREILDLWNELVEKQKSFMRELTNLKDRKDYEIWILKRDMAKYQALYQHENWKNTTLAALAIIACLLMLWMWIYAFM